MRTLRYAFAASIGLVAAGCLNTKLKPGFCEREGDCQSGFHCQAQMCVCDSVTCDDGGMAGMGGRGGDGGSGGMGGTAGDDGGQDVPPTCQPNCTAPRSICSSTLTCVECLTSVDCKTATKPICDATSGACVACTGDEQCASKLGPNPGACLAHLDGRCATDAETIYVQNEISTCSDTVEAGDAGTDAATLTRPFCSMQPVPIVLRSPRMVVVVRGTVSGERWTYGGEGSGTMTVVGQQNALIGSVTTPAFHLQTGTAYIRGVKFSPSASIGIRAVGGTLRLEKVTVDSCMGGGILVDGAAFDIRNTTVTRSGAAQQPVVWGGMLVNSLPTSGPTQLRLVTIQNNMAPGLYCAASAAIQGDGVLATGNAALDVTSACNVTPCSPASPTCGAQ